MGELPTEDELNLKKEAISLMQRYVAMNINTPINTVVLDNFIILTSNYIDEEVYIHPNEFDLRLWEHANTMGQLLNVGHVYSLVPYSSLNPDYVKFRVSSYRGIYAVEYHMKWEDQVWKLSCEQPIDFNYAYSDEDSLELAVPSVNYRQLNILLRRRLQRTIERYRQSPVTGRMYNHVTENFRIHGPGGSIQPTFDELDLNLRLSDVKHVTYSDYEMVGDIPKVRQTIETRSGDIRLYHYHFTPLSSNHMRITDEFCDGEHITSKSYGNLNILRYGYGSSSFGPPTTTIPSLEIYEPAKIGVKRKPEEYTIFENLYKRYIEITPQANHYEMMTMVFYFFTIDSRMIFVETAEDIAEHARTMGQLLRPGIIDTFQKLSENSFKFRVTSYRVHFAVEFGMIRVDGVWLLSHEQKVSPKPSNYAYVKKLQAPSKSLKQNMDPAWQQSLRDAVVAYQMIDQKEKIDPKERITENFQLHGPGGIIRPTEDELVEHIKLSNIKTMDVFECRFLEDGRAQISATIKTFSSIKRGCHYNLVIDGENIRVDEEFNDGEHIIDPKNVRLNILRYGYGFLSLEINEPTTSRNGGYLQRERGVSNSIVPQNEKPKPEEYTIFENLYKRYIEITPQANRFEIMHMGFYSLTIDFRMIFLEYGETGEDIANHAITMGQLLRPGIIVKFETSSENRCKFRVTSYRAHFAVEYTMININGIWLLSEERQISRGSSNFDNVRKLPTPAQSLQQSIDSDLRRSLEEAVVAYRSLEKENMYDYVTKKFLLHGPGGTIQPTQDELVEHIKLSKIKSLDYIEYRFLEDGRAQISATIKTFTSIKRGCHYNLVIDGEKIRVDEEFNDGEHINNPINVRLNILRNGNMVGYV
ncbi:unnamed protein product [Caenorhabditis angaria]|uniref:Uncharacterized protein n=1 Tax=Caenorhabditis angaria TaxID=860376 RepID=A0A9P1IQ60_9PELO|nr:unnamed protein product [Caenorhabditis angaria]